MAVDVRVERSASAILQILREVAPAEAALFEGDFCDALQQAPATSDLSPVNRVVSVMGHRSLISPAFSGQL